MNVMARDKALYHGHAVAAVAAISASIAEEALDLIEIVYETLPHVIEVEAAMAADAPVLHEHLFTGGLETRPDKPSNIAKRNAIVRGDLAAGFAEAEVVVEGRYVTAAAHQGYIEPHACVATLGAGRPVPGLEPPARASSWSAPTAPRCWAWKSPTSA